MIEQIKYDKIGAKNKNCDLNYHPTGKQAVHIGTKNDKQSRILYYKNVLRKKN